MAAAPKRTGRRAAKGSNADGAPAHVAAESRADVLAEWREWASAVAG